MGNSLARARRPSQAEPPQFDSIDTPAVGIPVATAAVAPPPASTDTPTPAPPVPPSAADSRLTLNVTSEREALSHDAQHSLLAMISLRAPSAPTELKRPPIDLVACIDRSGSMHGDKMRLMKQTLELLVTRAGLNGEDRISFVTFDREVKLALPLEPMSAAGRAKAEAVIQRVQPGSTTNLSGGALKSIDVLAGSARSLASDIEDVASSALSDAQKRALSQKLAGQQKQGRTRAVMLFTDGLANEGIVEPSQIVAAVSSALAAASAALGGPISLYTFGFGADHNETCLRALATESGASGLYYYVNTSEDIPNAFADCLGGLTSVVAQNATLTLEALPLADAATGDANNNSNGALGASVTRVLGSTYKRNEEGAIELGDLFAEDQKDVLVELCVPRLPAPLAAPAPPALRASLRAFNVLTSAAEVAEATLYVARPATTPPDQPVNTELDAQRNRIEAAEAMEAASGLADAGNLEQGRSLLRAAKARIGASASSAGTFSTNLYAEMDSLEEQYESATAYRSLGSKMSKMQAMSHQRQRAVHTNAGMYAAAAKNKQALKKKWALSSIKGSSGADDSDSD